MFIYVFIAASHGCRPQHISQSFCQRTFCKPHYKSQRDGGIKYLVLSGWYQVLGTRYLVPSVGITHLVPWAWYQVPGRKYLVPSTWYQVLRTKYLVAWLLGGVVARLLHCLVPWFLGCLVACLLFQGVTVHMVLGVLAKGSTSCIDLLACVFGGVLTGPPCLPSLFVDSALGVVQRSAHPDVI